MITTQKQLIENADTLQEKIAQVQREGTGRHMTSVLDGDWLRLSRCRFPQGWSFTRT